MYTGNINKDGTLVVKANSGSALPASINKDAITCVRAHQPYASWSRAEWLPLVKKLEQDAFINIIKEQKLPSADRVRALEVLTECFDGPSEELVLLLAEEKDPSIKAKAIWALARSQNAAPPVNAIATYMEDQNPMVLRHTLEALYGAEPIHLNHFIPELTKLAGHKDRFVRQAVCRLLTQLVPDDFKTVATNAMKHGWDAALTISMAYTIRKNGVNDYALDIGLRILKDDSHPVSRKLQAIKVMQLALGGVTREVKGFPAVFQGYTPGLDLSKDDRKLDPYRIELAKLFPTQNAKLDHELARLIAMLKGFDPALIDKLNGMITDDTHPVDDIHYLISMALVQADRNSRQREKIADAFVKIDQKINELKLPQDSHWEQHMRAVYKTHCKHDTLLSKTVIGHKLFGRPGHITFLLDVPDEMIPVAVEKFLIEIKKDEQGYPWTNDTIFLLSESEDPETLELIRRQVENHAVRPAAIMVLAANGDTADRNVLLLGLEQPQLETVEACLDALEKMAPSRDPNEQVALVFAGRRLRESKREMQYRDRIFALLERNTKQDFGFVHGDAGLRPQVDAIKKWTSYIEERYPNAVATHRGQEINIPEFMKRLDKIDFTKGSPTAGAKLFTMRSCAQCHGGRQALGPDLTGATKRFSIPDLFTAIVDPHRDVSNRYQTTSMVLETGKSYMGMIVYESIDGLLLRNAMNQTIRIESNEIMMRQKSNRSIMPSGLLKDLTDEQLADLFAYINTIGKSLPRQKRI